MGLDLVWRAPTDMGGSALVAYQVEYSTDGQAWNACGELRPPDTTSLTLSGIDWSMAPQMFQLRVVAFNDDGAGRAPWPVMAMLPGPATGEPGFCRGGETIILPVDDEEIVAIVGPASVEQMETTQGSTETGSEAELQARIDELVDEMDTLADASVSMTEHAAIRDLSRRARWAVVDLSNGVTGGTGTFISSDGYLVTNAHVVRDGGDFVATTFDGQRLPAQVVAYVASAEPDVAVLKVEGTNLPFVPLGDVPRAGELVVYVGHPAGVLWAVTAGSVVGIDDSGYSTLVQVTNPGAEGASGSALLNMQGQVVGLIQGGTSTVRNRESTIARLQTEPVWSSTAYQAVFDAKFNGPTVGVLKEFLNQHIPGLVAGNAAAAAGAVTVNPAFIEPELPGDLCRSCLSFDDSTLDIYMAEDTLTNQVSFLEMMRDSTQGPSDVTESEKSIVATVGQSIQAAVVELVRTVAGGAEGGTGAFISPDGYLITNAHVVQDATTITVKTFDGRSFTGHVVGSVPHPSWRPDLALVKIDAEGLPWLPLAGSVELRDLVVGVGHPQGLKWAMYGGRVSYIDPELFWDGGDPDQYDLQFDAVDVGQGSSGSPIVNMAGEMVAVLSGSLADLSAPRSWRHLDGEWVESVVFWEQGLLDAAIHSLTMGPHVDLVREFVELRVPGMLAALPD